MAEETAEKPVVESFQLDHTKVKAPYVRYIDTETGPHGDVISNYDLRLTQPNKQAIPTGGLHTIEHTIAVLLRERIPGYIDCSPFGCRTGFHLLTWGTHSTEDVAWAALTPTLPGAEMIGASSDHLIVDVEGCGGRVKVGDWLDFRCGYMAVLDATTSAYVDVREM